MYKSTIFNSQYMLGLMLLFYLVENGYAWASIIIMFHILYVFNIIYALRITYFHICTSTQCEGNLKIA